MMLSLHPELVNQDAAEPGFLEELTEDFVERIMREGMRSITPNGILGDARGMSAEIGDRLIEATSDLIAEYFQQSS
jgi:creatinine amidohydrolase